METRFEQGGRMLALVGDLVGRWRRFPKGGYGFCESKSEELGGDWRVRVQIKVEARPKSAGVAREIFPPDLRGEYCCEAFATEIDGGSMATVVDLPVAAARTLPNSGKPGLFEGPVRVAQKDSVWYELTVWILFTAPPGRKPGDTKEWDLLPFLGGGLPETNRRRF